MIRTLVVYASRYGSTEEAARYMAMVLGPSKCISCQEFCDEYDEFEMVVLGGPVVSGDFLPELHEFVKQHGKWLRSKHLAMFSVGLEGSDSHIEEFSGRYELDLMWSGTLGGRLFPRSLSVEDVPAAEQYLRSLGLPVNGFDAMVEEDILCSALAIKNARDMIDSDMDENSRRQVIEGYLRSRNTCVLAVRSELGIRATPVEYRYLDGAIYILTEGGEKMAHILLQPEVALVVNDEFRSSSSLFGLQIRGRASIIKPRSAEYESALRDSGHDPVKVLKLPFDICLIRIDILEAELLSSALKKSGHTIRQRVQFPSL